MKINAIIASEEHKSFSYEEVEIDDPRDDEILVKIEAVGLCHTDVLARDGFYPIDRDAVLGHEGAGIVEKTGKNVSKVKPGDKVGISFRSCGHCPKCESSRASYCTDFVNMNIICSRPDGTRTLKKGSQELASNFFGQSVLRPTL